MGQISVMQRPIPPAGMPEAQCVYWRVVVDSMPADWFRPEQLPLREQFCRHSAASDQVAPMVEETEPACSQPSQKTSILPFPRWIAA
jgi:hypothetical protein